MSYRHYFDENGDETVELDGPFSLPASYRKREVVLAALNIIDGHDRRDMPISRNVLHLAVQTARRNAPGFGDKFRKDPRPFSPHHESWCREREHDGPCDHPYWRAP